MKINEKLLEKLGLEEIEMSEKERDLIIRLGMDPDSVGSMYKVKGDSSAAGMEFHRACAARFFDIVLHGLDLEKMLRH